MQPLFASLLALAAGQVIMLALSPISRASGTFAASAGLPIIAPDSKYYLRPSGFSEVFALPWTRWGYPLLLQTAGSVIDRPVFAVLVNSLAMLLAGAMLFRVLRSSFGLTAAAVGLSILSVNPMTAQWVRIVMTESVFFAAIAIACALSIRVLLVKRSVAGMIALLVTAAFATLTRPNGFLIAFAVSVVLARAFIPSRTARFGALLLLMLAVVPVGLLAHSASGPPSEGSITSQLYSGVVVEGASHVRTTIAMPPPRDVDDESLRAAAGYALEHPIATLRLGITRLVVETVQVRRHYPMFVNAGFGIGIAAILVAIAIGWGDARARVPRFVFLAIGMPLMLLTMATFAVPESRYGWAYLLAAAPLAGIGTDRSLAWFTHRRALSLNGMSDSRSEVR